MGFSWVRFWRPIQYRTFLALNGIDLEIKHGEKVGIVGRNGSGKTTLLKLITGNFSSTTGEVKINGAVQALMQTGLGFHGEFTGYENIKSSLIYNGLRGDELKRAVEDIVDFCELGDFISQPVKTYSLGMISRLQFATATAIKPDIVIIDEVLGAGDAYFNAKSAARINKLSNSGCTMLLVSHTMQQVIQFCERCLWLDSGKIRMDGAVRDVVGAYEVMMAKDIQKKSISRSSENRSVETILAKEILSEDEKKTDVSEYKQKLESGMNVFRWPSKDGIKVVDLKVNAKDNQGSIFYSGDSMEIVLTAECELNGNLNVCFHIAIFDEGGVRVAWITSPVDSFEAVIGKRRKISIKLNELLLSEGSYTLSLSLFDGTNTRLINENTRFDLIARCYTFRVISHDIRPKPIFYHPSNWYFETFE